MTDIPGTEAWALYQAASLAEPGCEYFVDCEPAVKAMHQGPAACARDNNPLARVHGMMHHALSDVPPEAVIWMPSHVKPGGCGTITRGDGFLLTEIDVAANAEADRLAKRAVEEHRVPLLVRRQIKEHDELTARNAMWIARAAATANDQEGDPARDTEASRALAAAAAAAKRKHNAAAHPGTSPTFNPQTGKRCSTRLRKPGNGGHTLERVGGSWRCTQCRKKSLTWSKLAPQLCTGMPTGKWESKANERDPKAAKAGGKHHVVVSDPVFWCTTCGAYGVTAPKLLTRPCKPRSKAYGMREQLRCLRTGKHPRTLMSLPPPIPLDQWKLQQAAAAAAPAAADEAAAHPREPNPPSTSSTTGRCLPRHSCGLDASTPPTATPRTIDRPSVANYPR